MVFNDSFSALFGSPASLKKASDSFNESFGDKTTLSPSTIFRGLRKEHDHISSILRFHPPTLSQYQNSLIELISLYERAEDQSTPGFQKLILSIFLKLAANILTGLAKPKYQPTLYKLSQLIASSVSPDLGAENEIEERQMQKWADRIVIESSIHLLDFPNFQIDLEFKIDKIVDDLGLASGRFQFVKSSIFEAAREIVSDMKTHVEIKLDSRFTLENVVDEPFLQLILWAFLRQKSIFNGDLLPQLFRDLPQTPDAEALMTSPISMLDVKLYLVSLAVISSTTTEAGMRAKTAPSVASQLSLTKQQKECWKSVVDLCSEKPASALSRLRVSQLTDSVRLTSDGSEDVRVLFEAWKCCLQPSAAHDEHVFAAVKALTEVYRTKMNSILAYGPFYSTDRSFAKQSSGARRDMKTLFPLQFDYEFVDTTEADHIGVVINSLEGYLNAVADSTEEDEENYGQLDVVSDDTFHSFATASDGQNHSADNSQFFSPMRPSMCPSAISQLIREESAANSSHISTKSVILTPTRKTAPLSMSPVGSTSSRGSGQPQGGPLSFERLQTIAVSTPKKQSEAPPKLKYFEEETAFDEDEYISNDEEEEEDALEAALLESTQKHEEILLAQKSPQKAAFSVHRTPVKDAQTETDEEINIFDVERNEKHHILTGESVKEQEEVEEDDEEEEFEDEEEDEDLLTEDVEEEIFRGTLEATAIMYRDHHMAKYGIESQKIDYDNMTEDAFLREAEERLAKMKTDMSEMVKRVEKLQIPTINAFPQSIMSAKPFVPVANRFSFNLPPMSIEPLPDVKQEHDPSKCLGCQSDDVQEAALRYLEHLALEWDAEGNDYLYQ